MKLHFEEGGLWCIDCLALGHGGVLVPNSKGARLLYDPFSLIRRKS